MNIRYRVELSQDERDQLTALLSGGKHPARKIKRAQILLAADAGIGDEAIAASVSVGGSTVYRTKRRFVEGDLELALAEEARPGAGRKLTGREEALLVTTACSNPPAGRARSPSPTMPCSWYRCTQSRSVWRSMPQASAASGREAPSSTIANARMRRTIAPSRRPDAACRNPSAESSIRVISTAAAILHPTSNRLWRIANHIPHFLGTKESGIQPVGIKPQPSKST